MRFPACRAGVTPFLCRQPASKSIQSQKGVWRMRSRNDRSNFSAEKGSRRLSLLATISGTACAPAHMWCNAVCIEGTHACGRMPPGDSRESTDFRLFVIARRTVHVRQKRARLNAGPAEQCAVLVGYSANQERFQTWIGGRVASKRRPDDTQTILRQNRLHVAGGLKIYH